MSEKQRLLDAVAGLPESANWSQFTDVLLDLLANRGMHAEFSRLYRTQMTADQLAEHLNPKTELELSQVVAEIKARHASEGA